MLPLLLALRPSQRDALDHAARRNHDRANLIAQAGGAALLLVVVLTIAIRGC